jgi:hypothetical protein
VGGGSPTPRSFTADLPDGVVDLITFSAQGEDWVCAAGGSRVHLLTQEGRFHGSFRTDGPIRVLCWWDVHQLLLVGCKDEKVIAFDLEGRQKWTFVSEMHPDVYRAGKTYWFKSARGHEGIHGLHTGYFQNGMSQAFVGSACTLEILNEEGKLVERLPVFWGPGSRFALIRSTKGGTDLLIARQPTDSHSLAVVNSRTLDTTRRGFYGVPDGHTYIGGWASMSRKHILYDDLDGDRVKEVVSEINGTWNRVTVWGENGSAQYNANFGPGKRIPAGNMRDLDIGDLDGNGTKEILAATSKGLVVALDAQCNRVWSRRLPSPPTVLAYVHANGAPWVVAGSEGGSITVFDGAGSVSGSGKVSGNPTCIQSVHNGVIVATDAGVLTRLRVGSLDLKEAPP